MRLSGRQNVVVRLVLLHHQPHAFDIVASVSPIAFGVQVAKIKLILQPYFDRRDGSRNFTGDERFAASRAFMVEVEYRSRRAFHRLPDN